MRLRLFVANYGVYIALLALLLAATVLTPRLYDVNTIAVVMRQASQLGIVAIGQTLILLVAGLDLSVGGHLPYDLLSWLRMSPTGAMNWSFRRS